MSTKATWIAAVILGACGPAKVTGSGTSSTSSGADTDSTASTDPSGSTTSSASSSVVTTTIEDLTATSPAGETSSGGESSSSGTSRPCWYADADCPDGYKCDAVDGECTGPKCQPIPPRAKQIGELCQHDGHQYCHGDDCGAGLFCAGNFHYTCLAPCIDAQCPEGQSCWSEFAGLGVCALQCDRLLQDCPPGMACNLNPYQGFSCTGSPRDLAGLTEPCPNYNECAPGLHCNTSPVCPGGCCTPFCDSNQPDACAAVPGTTCMPIGATDPPGLEHVGVCW